MKSSIDDLKMDDMSGEEDQCRNGKPHYDLLQYSDQNPISFFFFYDNSVVVIIQIFIVVVKDEAYSVGRIHHGHVG